MSQPQSNLTGASGGAALTVGTPAGPAGQAGHVALQASTNGKPEEKRRRTALGGWIWCLIALGVILFIAIVVVAALAGAGKLRKSAKSSGTRAMTVADIYTGFPCVMDMPTAPPVTYARAVVQLDGTATTQCDGADELATLLTASEPAIRPSLSIMSVAPPGDPLVFNIWLLLAADDPNAGVKMAAFSSAVGSPTLLEGVETATGLSASLVEPFTTGPVTMDVRMDDQSMDDMPTFSGGGGGGGGAYGPDANPYRTACTEPDMVANFPLTVIDSFEGANWGMPSIDIVSERTADQMVASANGKTLISGYQLSANGAMAFPDALGASGDALDIQTQAIVPASDTTSGKDIGVFVTNRDDELVVGAFGDDGNVVYDNINPFSLPEARSGGAKAEIIYLGDGKLAVASIGYDGSSRFAVVQVNATEQLELVQDLSSVIAPQKLLLNENNKLYFMSGEPQLLSRLDHDGSTYSVTTIADTEGFVPALVFQGAIYGQGGAEIDLFKFTEAGGLELAAEMTPLGGDEARVLPTGVCGDKLFIVYNDLPVGTSFAGYSYYNNIAVVFANGTRGPDLQKVAGQDVRGRRSTHTTACAEGFLYIHNAWGPPIRIDARTNSPFIEVITAFDEYWPTGPESAFRLYAEPPGVGANSGNSETRVYMHMGAITKPPSSYLWVHVQHKANQTEMQLEVPNVVPNAAGNSGGLLDVCALGPDLTVAVYDYVGSWNARKLQVRQVHSNQTTTVLAEGSYGQVSGLFTPNMVCSYSANGDGTAYFPFASAADGLGREIYYWKPGMSSPSLLVDAQEGAEGSDPQRLSLVGDRLYFYASTGHTLMMTLPDNTTSVVSPTYSDASEDASALEVLGVQLAGGDWRAFALVPVEGTSTSNSDCQLMTMGPSDSTMQVVDGVDVMSCPSRTMRRENKMAVHDGSVFVAYDNSNGGTLPYVRGLIRVNPNDLSSELLEGEDGLYSPHSLVSAADRLYFVTNNGGKIAYLDTSVSSPSGSDIHQLSTLSTNGYNGQVSTFGVTADGDLISCVVRHSHADQFTVIEPVSGNFTELGGHTAGCAFGGTFCAGSFTRKVGDISFLGQKTGAFGYELLIYPVAGAGR